MEMTALFLIHAHSHTLIHIKICVVYANGIYFIEYLHSHHDQNTLSKTTEKHEKEVENTESNTKKSTHTHTGIRSGWHLKAFVSTMWR